MALELPLTSLVSSGGSHLVVRVWTLDTSHFSNYVDILPSYVSFFPTCVCMLSLGSQIHWSLDWVTKKKHTFKTGNLLCSQNEMTAEAQTQLGLCFGHCSPKTRLSVWWSYFWSMGISDRRLWLWTIYCFYVCILFTFSNKVEIRLWRWWIYRDDCKF